MSFSFPTSISTEEILQCLADLQIYLDVGQLTKPTSDAVRACYEQAVIALTGITREELQQPKFSALAVFEHPELHDDSIPAINFIRQITKLMHICGVRDFTLNDVYKPEPARLRRNLCALINFAKFRDEKVAMLDDLEQALQGKMQRDCAMQAEYDKNLAEVKRLKELRAARQGMVAPIEAETANIAAQNAQLNKTQAALQGEVRTLKSLINTLTDQAAEAKILLSSLQAEAEQLQDQIVQSPEKHRMAIADLVSATEQQRCYYAALCSASNDHDRKLELISKFGRELQRCIKMQEELEGVVARKKEVSAAVKDTREAIATEERRYSELASKNQTARRQLASLQDKFSRIEQQGQLKVDAAAAMLEEQQKRREAVEAEHAAGDARAAEQEAQIRGWRERTAEVVAQKDAKARAVLDKYAMVRRAVTEYNRKLEAALSAPHPDAPPGYGGPGTTAAATAVGGRDHAAVGGCDGMDYEDSDVLQERDTESLRQEALAAAAAVSGMQGMHLG